MTTSTTLTTLRLLAEIAKLDFFPMDDNDRCSFDGADADAQIATIGTAALSNAVTDILGEPLDCPVLAIASGARVEIHGIKATGEPVCLGFDIADLI